jgi:hypothetical protein
VVCAGGGGGGGLDIKAAQIKEPQVKYTCRDGLKNHREWPTRDPTFEKMRFILAALWGICRLDNQRNLLTWDLRINFLKKLRICVFRTGTHKKFADLL